MQDLTPILLTPAAVGAGMRYTHHFPPGAGSIATL